MEEEDSVSLVVNSIILFVRIGIISSVITISYCLFIAVVGSLTDALNWVERHSFNSTHSLD